MALSVTEAAAATLPPNEEIEEVYRDDDEITTLGEEGAVEKPDEEDTEPDADTVPVVETPAEPEAGEEPAATLTPEQEKAKAFDDLNASFTRDPAGYLKYMASLMTPEQRAAAGLVEAEAAKDEPITGEGWEDSALTPPEKFVKANAAYIKDLPRFAQGVINTAATHERYLIQHDADLAALNAKMDAVALAMGLELPTAKTMADQKARADYAAETKAAATKLKMVRTAAETVTPKTPKNGAGGSNESAAPPANATFQQMFRWAAKQAAAK